jgi:restriction system protein
MQPKTKNAPAAPAYLYAPDCPKCGKAMTKREAKGGPNGGRRFWACTQFPACLGMRLLF